MKEIFVLKKNSHLDCGEGSLASLLKIPHEGENVGVRTLLNILYPISKRQQVTSDNTMWLLRVYEFKGHFKPFNADSKFYNEISFYKDDCGRVSYLSVPSDWMEVKS
jgi:hypothetical protein